MYTYTIQIPFFFFFFLFESLGEIAFKAMGGPTQKASDSHIDLVPNLRIIQQHFCRAIMWIYYSESGYPQGKIWSAPLTCRTLMKTRWNSLEIRIAYAYISVWLCVILRPQHKMRSSSKNMAYFYVFNLKKWKFINLPSIYSRTHLLTHLFAGSGLVFNVSKCPNSSSQINKNTTKYF